MSTQSLTQQSFYLIIGRCFAYGLTILTPIVLVRVFDKNQFGLYGQLLLIYTSLLPLGEMGITQGLYYFLPRKPEKKSSILTQSYLFVIATGVICSIAILIFASSIARYFHNPDIERYAWPLALYTFFMIGSTFFEATLIAEGKAQAAAVVIVILQILNSAIIIGTVAVSRSILYLIWALAAFGLLRFVSQAVYLSTKYRINMRNVEILSLKEHLKFSASLGFANIAWILQAKLQGYLVSFFFNPIIFAVFSIGTLNLPIVTMITASASNVMLPALSLHQKDGRSSHIIAVRNNAIRKMNLFLCPIFAFFFFTSTEFITAFFTANYLDSVPIFRISLLGVLMASINNGVILSAFGETKYLLKLAIIRLPLSLLCLIIATRFFGVYGTVATGVMVVAASIMVEFSKISKILSIPYRHIIKWGENIRILLVSLFAACFIPMVRLLSISNAFIFLAIALSVYVLSYIALSILFSTIRVSELTSLYRQVLATISPLKMRTGEIAPKA